MQSDLLGCHQNKAQSFSFLIGAAERADGVRVDDGGAAARHHRPDAAPGVEDGQLERGARLGVDVGDVGLLGEGVAPERRRVLDLAPLAAADEVGRRVDLRKKDTDLTCLFLLDMP